MTHAAGFTRRPQVRLGRNYLRAGDPCRVHGERGVFRFVAHVHNPTTGAAWLEVLGPSSNPRTRSFRVERVRRVARTTPTR